MKKLVLAALAIGAMAACTKSTVQYEQPGEISLQPVTQKATKAAVDGTDYPTSINFNVWAWWRNRDANTGLDEFIAPDNTDPNDVPIPYIAKGEFEYKSGTSWGGTTPYYWPTKGSLVFAGYSPANARATNFNYDLEHKKFTVENFIQSNEIDKTVDLMWFDVTDESYDQNGTDSKGVPVTFKHALSWLTFNFVLDKEITNHKWEITGVELQPVHTTANFSASESWIGHTDTKSSMTIYTKGDEVKYLTTTSEKYENIDKGVVVIPQECVKLQVNYNLTASTGQKIQQDVKLDLTAGDDGDSWLPGKHYVYTVVFGANEILVSPTVTDWEDKIVDNIPVQ